jgi:hypothetical protein
MGQLFRVKIVQDSYGGAYAVVRVRAQNYDRVLIPSRWILTRRGPEDRLLPQGSRGCEPEGSAITASANRTLAIDGNTSVMIIS